MGVFQDLKELGNLAKHGKKFTPKPRSTCLSLGQRVQDTAAANPGSLMCIFEEQTWTWREFNELSNQLAAMLKGMGIKKGDVVSVLIDNRVENMAATTAICKLGAISGLINTHLTGTALQHCVESVAAKKIIVGEELVQQFNEIRPNLDLSSADDVIFIKDKGVDACPDWATEFISEQYPVQNHPETDSVCFADVAYYIFTSGTTGLPKASIITHERDYRATASFAYASLQMKPSDRIYLCLPLYHSSAMFVGFGSISHVGASMFLRRKFSASNFLDEARKYNTNCFVYIGELCRYLMHQPAQIDDHKNPIVKCTGNGLRPDIWMDFKKRFGLKRIAEFYGSSEGNLACMNLLNRDLTIGFCSSGHALVEYDVLNDELVRDSQGFLKKVAPGKPGLMLGKIAANAKFDGYVSKEATESKILRNVFKEGDSWFNTGDILQQADVGFTFKIPHYQFIDRVGDTYRWKGENVSTNEIGELINSSEDIQYCNIYGVQIPGTDGRAGMAAIIPEGGHSNLDINAISKHIVAQVASYARPLFIRVLTEDMDTTGTFKMKKGELREEAYHPDKIPADPLYVLKPGSDTYEVLDKDFYQQILNGKAGF